MVKKAFRVLLIFLLGTAVLLFGLRYGTPPKPAHAEIFRELSGLVLLQQRGLGSATGVPPWRITRVNNNFIYYNVNKREGSVHALFDSVEKAVRAGRLLQPSQPPPVEVADRRKQQAPAETPVVQLILRQEWRDWGIMVFTLHGSGQGAHKARIEGIAAPIETSAALVAFVAFSNGHEGATTYLTFLLDDSFDFRALLSSGEKDAPGRDAPGVPRYPGLKRTYTFEEIGDSFESVMAVYQGKGNYHSVAEFYRSLMIGRGWEPREISTAGAGRRSERMLFFARSGAECTLYTTSPKPGVVQTIVSLRFAKAEG